MARKPWIHFAGALYHVISRGNRGQVVFRDEGDYKRYRSFFGKLAGHRVKAVADHFHRDPVGLSQGMQKLEVRLRRDGTVQGAVKGIEETLIGNRKGKYFITYACPPYVEHFTYLLTPRIYINGPNPGQFGEGVVTWSIFLKKDI